MNYVICSVCGAAIQDAERGPIVAAYEHRMAAHGPMVMRFSETKEMAPNPDPMIQHWALKRGAYHRRKARAMAS